MAKKLFNTIHLPQVLQDRIERAVAAVKALDRATFLQPTLAGRLESIVAENALEVATINPPHGGKPGAPGFIDVAMVYRGDGKTFDMVPGRVSISPWLCEVHDGVIVASIREGDDQTQQRVDTFFRDARDNLNVLRSEAAEGRTKIEEAVRAAGEARRKAIIAENEHDKGLNFSIQR